MQHRCSSPMALRPRPSHGGQRTRGYRCRMRYRQTPCSQGPPQGMKQGRISAVSMPLKALEDKREQSLKGGC